MQKKITAASERPRARTGGLLTPEELREFELRHSPTAGTFRGQYAKSNLSEAIKGDTGDRSTHFHCSRLNVPALGSSTAPDLLK